MFVGALAGFKVSLETGNPWLGLALGDGRRAALALLHAIVCIHFQADQIVSGLALTFAGHGGRAGARRGTRERAAGAAPAHAHHPAVVVDPVHRPGVLHRPERPGVRGLSAGAAWHISGSTTPGRACTCAPWVSSRRRPMPWASSVYRRDTATPGRRCTGGSGGRDHQHGRDDPAGSRTRRHPASAGSRSASSSSPSGARAGRSSAPTSSPSSGA